MRDERRPPLRAGKYVATREDVLNTVGPVGPHPLTGPDNPDPFGHNLEPRTPFIIACRIARRHRFPAEVVHQKRLKELLVEMAADGSIAGLTPNGWAAVGRMGPSRSRELLYASVAEAKAWTKEYALDSWNETPTMPITYYDRINGTVYIIAASAERAGNLAIEHLQDKAAGNPESPDVFDHQKDADGALHDQHGSYDPDRDRVYAVSLDIRVADQPAE